jgi:hypothetical protein
MTQIYTQHYVQLTLFPESVEENHQREIRELKRGMDKMRKSLHAKNGSLAKSYLELKNEFEQLKLAICKAQVIEQEQRCFL